MISQFPKESIAILKLQDNFQNFGQSERMPTAGTPVLVSPGGCQQLFGAPITAAQTVTFLSCSADIVPLNLSDL